MHLQTLAITINQSLIGKVRLLMTMLHHNPQTFRSGDFFVADGTGLEQQRRPQRNRKFHSAGGYSFIGKYGILGLIQQIGTCRGEAPPSCYARPFCHLKAPLGLSLFRFAPQTRICYSPMEVPLSSLRPQIATIPLFL